MNQPITQHAPRRSFFDVARRIVAIGALAGLTMCNINHVDFSAGGKATIPHGTIVDTLLGSLAFTGFGKIDFSEQFQNQGVTKSEVDSVNLKSFTLTIDTPSDGSFDFLDSITFYAESDGLQKVQIATMNPVPKGKKQLDLTVDATVDLAPYVTAPAMSITTEAQGSRPNEDTTLDAEVTLDVAVHIPGCG